MHARGLLLVLCCFTSTYVFADQTTLLEYPNAGSDKPVIYGNVDIAYNYLSERNHFINGGYNHLNDISLNGVALQQLNLTFSNLPHQGFGQFVNVIMGQDARSLAPLGYNPNIFNIENIQATPIQAYLQYVISNATLQVGQQTSLAGIEEYDYIFDSQFSRSLLNNFAQPGSHLGIRFTQIINSYVTLIAGVNNGWSSYLHPGQQNSLEGGLLITPSSAVSITLDVSQGPQQLANQTSGRDSQRRLYDFYATWYATPQLSFAINGDYASQAKAALPYGNIGRAVWQGLAGYVTYNWRDKWLGALRAEIYNDSDGYTTGVPQNLRELSLSLAYKPLKNVQVRIETRRDISNVNAYVNKNSTGTSHHIQAYSLDLLYMF